jgi:hypothetical protein
MIVFIRNFLIMRIKKRLNKSLLFCLFIITFILFRVDLYAEAGLIIDATNSQGYWEKGLVTNRKAVFTDKPFVVSEIQANIPISGRYQIFAHVYHNWRRFFPCIYMEAIDSEEKEHKGSHKIENIWYLNGNEKGRWFFISLAENPYWDLPKGKLSLKFWAAGKKSGWDNSEVPMEGRIYIENFFIVPVLNTETNMFLPFIINVESGKGNWDISYYDPRYATNLIKTKKKNSVFLYEVNMPLSGYYQLLISVISPLNNRIEISAGNKLKKQKINIKLNNQNQWSLVSTKPFYLVKGYNTVIFKILTSNEIMIDFLMISPSFSKIGE